MPATRNPPANAPPEKESMYPVLEQFVERASADDVNQLFASLRSSLGGLKGPRSEQAKKVESAISLTEELLSHLLQVREKLQLDAGSEGTKPKGQAGR
jgi:hypothetical protein